MISRRRALAATGGVLAVLGGAAAVDWADDGSTPRPRDVARAWPSKDRVPQQERRVLNVVAHHDDDLLFLSPDLLSDLESGAHVRTVYLMASDYVGYPKYMRDREAGVRAAYAFALGRKPSEWTSRPYAAGGVQATLWTLDERVSVLETRIPDGHMLTDPGAKRMWALYADGGSVQTRDGDTFPAQHIDRTAMVAFLQGVRDEFRPTCVNTLDPTADLHGSPMPTGGIHQDHISVARMVMYVFEGTPDLPVSYYRDYTITSEPDNLSPAATRAKAACFKVYTEFDPDAQRSRVYRTWYPKTYQVDERWRAGLVVPLPPPLRPGPTGNPSDAPLLAREYRLVNPASGLAVAAASGAGGALTLKPESHGTVFRTQAVRFGWRLVTKDGSGCLATPDPAKEPQGAPTVSECRHDPALVFRIRAGRGGYLVTVAGSGAALTADARLGTVSQQPEVGSPEQCWRFAPV
ncbi:hypothetical protein EHYA_01961 [Embleya hyalina]|uniref:Ricin B lectin domain-containing protein n=1 Tax=Embleya hyalina TaxID=516124 RepID=A0A401YI83_9ACTN|nr:hypothetical protein EHYA_01961 [Embleya hyalina]